MSKPRYCRVPLSEPDLTDVTFTSLTGPSYFSYGAERGKYKSAFTYRGSFETVDTKDEVPAASLMFRFCVVVATIFGYLALVFTLPVSAWFALKNVKSYERIVTYRLGRLLDIMGPGYVIVIPILDKWTKVDLRIKAFSVPPQKVITLDGATIEIGAEVYFRISDVVMSVSKVQDLNHSTRILCQTLLQRHMGKQRLGDIQDDRNVIISALLADVSDMTCAWGVEVEKIELSGVKVYSQPNQLFGDSTNPLNFLGPILFPPGTSNAPVRQLQQLYGVPLELAAPSSSDNQKMTIGAPFSSSVMLRTPADLIKSIQGHLGPSLVRDFGCVYRFVVTNELGNSDVFYLDLKNGEGSASVGEPPSGSADVSISLSSSVLSGLLSQQVSAFNAYMEGLLVVSGDLRAAMKLGNLIETINK